jgi:arylsulfatase A-like enzyme
MKNYRLRLTLFFCFFFTSFLLLRMFGVHIQTSGWGDVSTISRLIVDEIGVAAVFALFAVSWPYVATGAFAIVSLLYLASEHHMAIQGVFLRPRNLLDERIFRPELTSCYVSSISVPFIFATILVASGGLYLGHRARSNTSPSFVTLRRRVLSIAGGVVGLGYTCMCSLGPLAIFMASLWYQISARGALADYKPTVHAFTPYSAYPSLPSDRPPRPETPAEKMNVVVIHVESLGDVSGRVNGVPVMTSLERLAKNGVTWRNAYAVGPYSSRAIVATQSGRYPPNSRENPFGLLKLSDYECLASDFKKAAYRTGYFTADNFTFYGSDRLKQICTYDIMRDAKSYESLEPEYRNSLGADERTLFNAAYEWIRSSKDGFFITIQTLLPHHPYRTPPNWNRPASPGGLKSYHDAISYVDHNLNLFLDRLEADSLLESTIIVVMGDHGEAFEQHAQNRIHSAFLYEENLRIPLIISNPGLFPTQHSSENMASLIDIAATVYDLTGVRDSSNRHDGKSLFAPQDRRMVFMSTAYSHDILALRDGVFKFIWTPETREAQLYNLKVDPDERENLVASFPGRVRFYMNALASWDAHTRTAGARASEAHGPLAFLHPSQISARF